MARYYEGDDVEPEEVIEDTDSEDAELPEVAIQRTAATAKKINKKPKPQSATKSVMPNSEAIYSHKTDRLFFVYVVS